MSKGRFNTMEKFRKVLVLYVGGTIGMQQNEKGGKIVRLKHFRTSGGNTVIYELVEYSPLLDSSNMSAKDWIRIANDIENYYHKYDGFVVLHGTDTMAYTSSALSFMLEGLKKPVIVTGSQIPIFETRSDAKENFLSSLIIAGCYTIPEVCIFFSNKLLRGNRTTKISSDELDAFNSPNYHTLADVGINVKVNQHYILKEDERIPFKVHKNLNSKVAILSFFPTITCKLLEYYLNPPIEGVVIQSYGAGNLPSNRPDILDVLKKAVKKQILVINVTQCPRGSVTSAYEGGKVLERIGVTSGEDMTAEAALTKLMYVLSLPHLTYCQRVKIMKTDLRGEMTTTH